MDIQVPIFTKYDDNDITDLLFTEASGSTTIVKNYLEPYVTNTLNDPIKDKKFKKLISDFINRNMTELNKSGPINLIPVTDIDKDNFFDLFGINKKELISTIASATSKINDKANWKLIQQNPLFSLLYMAIRHYIIKKDDNGVKAAITMYALASYPSVFSLFFKHGAKEDVMAYTIDNLTEKFTIKKEGTIFKTLVSSITGSFSFLKKEFIGADDVEIVRWVTRIRNDQKSLIKKIANLYYDNDKKGLRILTQTENFGDGNMIQDTLNNTGIVENVTRKVSQSMIINGVDTVRASAAAKFAQISMSDLRMYLTRMIVDKKVNEISKFIESVLFTFLYIDNYQAHQINDKVFLSFALNLFRRTNSKDDNIVTIRTLLDKWSDDLGIHDRFRRIASQINYKKGLFMYIILCIQYYNN
jgi:hypothetical protein